MPVNSNTPTNTQGIFPDDIALTTASVPTTNKTVPGSMHSHDQKTYVRKRMEVRPKP
jgi:hypothetical protein